MISEPKRPASSQEREVVLAALQRAPVESFAANLISQVADLQVVAHCGCGCCSVDFESDLATEERSKPIADGLAKTPKGGLLGVIVWGTASRLTGLELYDMGAGVEDQNLPVPSSICSWKQYHTAQAGTPADGVPRASSHYPADVTQPKEMRTSPRRKIGEEAVKATVVRIQRAYVVLGMLAIVSAIVTLFDESSPPGILKDFILLLIYGTLYLGLWRRKEWVIPLVLVFSAGSFLSELSAILRPAEDVEAVLEKLFSGLLLMFFVYQFVFFSRREVRLFFGSKGRILF